MTAIDIAALSHRYGERVALDQLSLAIDEGEVFLFLGPNGGGKTTLFRILATLIAPQSGSVRLLGHELPRDTAAVRRNLGVVFQAPSLDKKLTVAENLSHQGRLYGLAGRGLATRQDELLARFGLTGRAGDLVETLSGGLRRRVELAKGLLHRPRLLLLDEPSTGLDPGVRSELWDYLQQIRRDDGVTVVMTTHLLEEADKADRLAILDAGRLVALGRPLELRSTVGGDSILIDTPDPPALAASLAGEFQVAAAVLAGRVRLELPQGHQWIARIVAAFPDQIHAITLAKPTLEDVFIARCGRRLD